MAFDSFKTALYCIPVLVLLVQAKELCVLQLKYFK